MSSAFGPAIVILQPQDGFEVPPITNKGPIAVQSPVSAQPPPAAGAPPLAAPAVSVAPLPVDSLQPVLVTGQTTSPPVTIQVDGGPLTRAALSDTVPPSLTFDFSATVTIPDSPGPHLIKATATGGEALATAFVTVWVGPPFAIAPASLLVELFLPPTKPGDLTENVFAGWTSDIQQDLTSIQARLNQFGLNIAGPAFALDLSRNAPLGVLRIGLWVTDDPFGAVPASPPGLPLPSLSEAQAAQCFGVTPDVLDPATTPHALAAAWLPTTTLQTLLDAASPAIVAAGARHNITVNTLTASTSPPDTVTVTANITFTNLGVAEPGSLGVTETLGTKTVSWMIGGQPTPLQVPTVTQTTPFSSTSQSVADVLLDIVTVGLANFLFAFNAFEGVAAAGDAGTKASGIIGPLLSDLPFAIPFRNTDLSSSDPLSEDFPLLSLNWTSFGATEDGVVGGFVPSLTNRTEADVVLNIQGVTDQSGQAHYIWALQNLDPDLFTWRVSGDGTAQGPLVAGPGDIVAGPLTQLGAFTFTVPINGPPGLADQFVLSVTASETCGSDPSQRLTADRALPITPGQTFPL
jgi:hypothetical protein